MNENESKLFAIRILIALFVGLCILIPAIYFRTKKLIKEGKSIKYLPIKMVMMIGFPLVSIPLLLDKRLSWRTKLIGVVLAGSVGILWGIGIDSMQKAYRKVLGLPPIDEDTGQVKKEDKE